MKKTLVLIVAFLLCFVSLGTILAEGETAASVYYTNIYTVEDNTDVNYDFILPVNLELESSATGKIKVTLKVRTNETMEKLGFTSLKLQKKNGSSWSTVIELNDEFEFTTSTFNYSDTFSNLISGSQYRVKVTIRARRAQGEVQDLTVTSSAITCH